MKRFVPLKLAACLALFVSMTLHVHAEPGEFDTSWQREGFRAAYVTTEPQVALELNQPEWTRFSAEVLAVDETTITIRFVTENLSVSDSEVVVYELATRRQVDSSRHAELWINDEDVARGSARIGGRTCFLILSTPAYHQFISGSRTYYFDGLTGLLLHAADYDDGRSTVRTSI